MKMGPNVRELIAMRMSVILIPPRTENPIGTAVASMTKPGNLAAVGKEAAQWVEQAIAVFKTAPDNPYGDDDEAIAGRLIEEAEKRLSPEEQRLRQFHRSRRAK